MKLCHYRRITNEEKLQKESRNKLRKKIAELKLRKKYDKKNVIKEAKQGKIS
jgi:hypothetical protein